MVGVFDPRLVVLLTVAWCASGARILLLPADHHSHVNVFTVAAKALIQVGHDARVLTVHRHQAAVARLHVPTLLPSQTRTASFMEDSKALDQLLQTQGGNPIQLFTNISHAMVNQCRAILEDEALMLQVQLSHFDLALVDGLDMARCNYLLPYKMGIPYITLATRSDPWAAGLPVLPSSEPLYGFGTFVLQPSLLDKLKNLAIYVATSMFLPPSVISDDLIGLYAPDKPPATFTQLYKRSEMWLVNLQTICLDWNRQEAPHYRYVGAMGTEPAKPLSNDLEKFVSKAKDGLIVVTFGSLIRSGPGDLTIRMLKAFQQVPQKIVMRHDGDIPEVGIPDNVLLTKWLPQNDLLGHTKTVLFITHGGNNGQSEALYHGIPMLTMPFFGDQWYNAQRIQSHGFGLTLNPNTFTPVELSNTILELTNNSTYLMKARRCSEISRNFPAPQDSLTFYVDHVLRFGGSHLKPAMLEAPLWRLLMLDVLLVCLFMTLVSIGCVTYCCKLTYRICKGPRDTKRKRE